MKHVKQTQHLQLIGRVAQVFGDRKASAQGRFRRVAVAARQHQRHAQGGLKMHLLGPCRAWHRRAQRSRAPTRHDISGSSDIVRNTGAAAAAKANADFHVAGLRQSTISTPRGHC